MRSPTSDVLLTRHVTGTVPALYSALGHVTALSMGFLVAGEGLTLNGHVLIRG